MTGFNGFRFINWWSCVEKIIFSNQLSWKLYVGTVYTLQLSHPSHILKAYNVKPNLRFPLRLKDYEAFRRKPRTINWPWQRSNVTLRKRFLLKTPKIIVTFTHITHTFRSLKFTWESYNYTEINFYLSIRLRKYLCKKYLFLYTESILRNSL